MNEIKKVDMKSLIQNSKNIMSLDHQSKLTERINEIFTDNGILLICTFI